MVSKSNCGLCLKASRGARMLQCNCESRDYRLRKLVVRIEAPRCVLPGFSRTRLTRTIRLPTTTAFWWVSVGTASRLPTESPDTFGPYQTRDSTRQSPAHHPSGGVPLHDGFSITRNTSGYPRLSRCGNGRSGLQRRVKSGPCDLPTNIPPSGYDASCPTVWWRERPYAFWRSPS